MTNAAAVAGTIAALRAAERLHAEHDAIVTAAASLAMAVDADPGNAALWREYRAVVNTLTEIGGDDVAASDEVADIIAALRGAAQVVDATHTRKAHTRRAGSNAR